MVEITSQQLRSGISDRLWPTITMWNRTEPRPRSQEFMRALRAEVRDALWMLSRQWQFGELAGEDAGTPSEAFLLTRTTPISSLSRGGSPPVAMNSTAPLEAQVEPMAIPLTLGGLPVALDLRLALGRRWLALVGKIGAYSNLYITHYAFTLPPAGAPGAALSAHAETVALLEALAGRAMDGGALIEHLQVPGALASDNVAVAAVDKNAVDDAGREFLAWYRATFSQPSTASEQSWNTTRLEHQFQLADAGDGTQLGAPSYNGSDLDWFTFDHGDAEPKVSAPAVAHASVPALAGFTGMPVARYWGFEDGKVNLAQVRPALTDMGGLLLLEFLLASSTDWCLSPVRVPVNAMAHIEGLVVRNVFGEDTWIKPAQHGSGGRHAWSLFDIAPQGPEGPSSLPLLATSAELMRGQPLEDVTLIRDEIANLVWGVELTIQSPAGGPKPGSEAGNEVRTAIGGMELPAPAAKRLTYRLETSTPEHWIPFQPARVEGSDRSIRLQRGSMRRIIGDRPFGFVKPRTSLLRPGLDQSPAQAYYINEEEVPRAGAELTLQYKRSRGSDGGVHVWLTASKGVGRGSGSSGLAFDLLIEGKPDDGS